MKRAFRLAGKEVMHNLPWLSCYTIRTDKLRGVMILKLA